jgi:hypothetical protein
VRAAKGGLVAHKWRFFRAGGVDQVQLSRGADLLPERQVGETAMTGLRQDPPN